MEKFSSLNVGDQFQSTTTITSDELDEYLGFSRIKNAMFEISTGKKEPSDENLIDTINYLVTKEAGSSSEVIFCPDESR